MITRALAVAAALTVSAGVAAAADTRLTAALEQPVAAKTRVIAGGAVWTCEGSTCSAAATSTRAVGFRGCQSLAKEVGALVSYGGKSQLEAAQLAKCNASAKAPTSTLTAAN